jgi:hypothetical protein
MTFPPNLRKNQGNDSSLTEKTVFYEKPKTWREAGF